METGGLEHCGLIHKIILLHNVLGNVFFFKIAWRKKIKIKLNSCIKSVNKYLDFTLRLTHHINDINLTKETLFSLCIRYI